MAAVDHRVVMDDGRRIPVAPPPHAEMSAQPRHAEPVARAWSGETRALPLGTIAYARCGDKGGNSNVGIWASDERAWPWLRQTLSSATLRELAPDWAQVDIVRHELPHLKAVHFVLRGLLGNGGSSNLRIDQVGKAVGEYVLSKTVDIPVELLDSTSR